MKRSNSLIIIAAFLIFSFDQISKAWVISNNWSIFLNSSSIVFGLIPVGSVGLILARILQLGLAIWFYLLLKRGGSQKVAELALGAFVGGSLGNTVDRLLRGGAVDWIDIKVWPIFNLADVAIVAGLFLMGYHIQRRYHESKNISS